MFYYFLYKLGQFLAVFLPLKGGYWLAEKAGSFWFFVNWKAREKVLNNLEVILQTKEAKELKLPAREVFVNFAKYLVEFFRFSELNQQFIEKEVKISNVEILKSFKNKGVILLSAHLGNWELGAEIVSKLGIKLNVIALSHKYEKIDLFFKNQRQKHGLVSIPPGNSTREILKRLKNGEAVALLGDRDFSHHGIKMNFFNKPALVPRGPAFFSIKTGCPILCLFLIREKDNSFTCYIEEPIYPETKHFDDGNVRRLNEKILSILEKNIKPYAAQWLMIHDLWSEDKNEKEEII